MTSDPVGSKLEPQNQREAAALVSILPVLIVFLFAQRFIVQGIALRGLKG